MGPNKAKSSFHLMEKPIHSKASAYPGYRRRCRKLDLKLKKCSTKPMAVDLIEGAPEKADRGLEKPPEAKGVGPWIQR